VDPGILQDARERFLDLKIAVRSAAKGTPLADWRDLAGVNYAELFGEYLKSQSLEEQKHRYVLEKGREVIRKVMAGEAGERDGAP
jgi:hypothetical protein